MGNVLKRNQGGVSMAPQQGGMYAPYQQQPMVQQQPMMRPMGPPMVQQPMVQQPMIQQPMVQQPMVQQQPVFAQQPAQYAPTMYPPQQGYYRPSFPSAPYMPRYPVSPPLSLPSGQNPGSYYENDAFLSSLTGWSVQDIERLRHEYLTYTNQYGVIDREGFRKLYIASLLNMTWEAIERDAEAAFRNFDINQTGTLDFNEYITACSRMTRETQQSYPGSQPPMNQSFNY